MKKLFLSTLGILIISKLFAQDFIIKSTGDEIKAKVLEITINEIKYKKFTDLEGPIISILKSEVFMIKYANGTSYAIDPFETISKRELAMVSKKKPAIVSNNKDSVSFNKRKPGLSLLFSALVPGLGQFYNHQPGKGIVMTAGYTASLIVLAIFVAEYGGALLNIPSSIGQGIFIWSVLDALSSSIAINKKYSLAYYDLFENDKFCLNLQPHLSFTYSKTGMSSYKPEKTLGAKLSINIK